MKCISCHKEITNERGAVKFLCPNCGKYEIVRCSTCRRKGTPYKCPACGFEGP